MMNEQILMELYKIGKLPDAKDSASDNFPLEEFDELLQQINKPVTEGEAIRLINLSPPVDTGCYGLEWELIKIIETIDDVETIQNVLDNSEENELKRIIQIRLDNYKCKVRKK